MTKEEIEGILCQQIKLMAEESKGASPSELVELSGAICGIAVTLLSL